MSVYEKLLQFMQGTKENFFSSHKVAIILCGGLIHNWVCNYVMQIPAESVLRCKRQFARSGQISE